MDEANCLRWLSEATDDDKLAVWCEIQKDGQSALDGIVRRFAQLDFTHAQLLKGENDA